MHLPIALTKNVYKKPSSCKDMLKVPVILKPPWKSIWASFFCLHSIGSFRQFITWPHVTSSREHLRLLVINGACLKGKLWWKITLMVTLGTREKLLSSDYLLLQFLPLFLTQFFIVSGWRTQLDCRKCISDGLRGTAAETTHFSRRNCIPIGSNSNE